MIQIFRRKSIIWSLFSSCVLVALTCDAINLDDLVPGVYVVHDFGDETQSDLAVSFSLPGHPRHIHRFLHVTDPSRRVPGKSDRAARIVFDEDSPSEAAETFSSSLLATGLNLDVQALLYDDVAPTSALHLLHCSFLI